jgi:hypothetical protein
MSRTAPQTPGEVGTKIHGDARQHKRLSLAFSK